MYITKYFLNKRCTKYENILVEAFRKESIIIKTTKTKIET